METDVEIIDQFVGSNWFLSNFYRHRIVYDGETYPTAEHAFQAAKTHDPEWKRNIREAGDPGTAKHYGSRVPLREDWEEVKIDIMRDILRAKFAPASLLRPRLRTTGDAMLIEGNHWGDEFWGIDYNTRKGKNWLGKLLMEVREEIADDE